MRAFALAVACLAIATRAEAKPKADAILTATAKACALPASRLAPTQDPTTRDAPAAAQGQPDDRTLDVGHDSVEWTDEDHDGHPDGRSRTLGAPGADGRTDCEIFERWTRGRWRPESVVRYVDLDEIITTFRNDRAVSVAKRSAIVE